MYTGIVLLGLVVSSALWVILAQHLLFLRLTRCGVPWDGGTGFVWPFLLLGAWVVALAYLMVSALVFQRVWRRGAAQRVLLVGTFVVGVAVLTSLYWYLLRDGVDPLHYEINVEEFCGGVDVPWWQVG